MKHNIIISIGLLAGACIISQSKAIAQDQITNAQERSYSERLKEAKKPFNYLRVDKMKVAKGMGSDYLEIERKWSKIHSKSISDGKMLGWSLWRPKNKNLGYDYITLQTYDSLDSMNAPLDLKDIGKLVGDDKLNALLKKTPTTRTNIGSEVWTMQDWTFSVEDALPDSLSIGFMAPTKGKDSEYAKMESDYFSKFWQVVADADESILSWQFGRLLYSSGVSVDYKYYTAHLEDSKKKPIGQSERNGIWKKLNFPSDLKMNKLRKMKGAVFELVMATDSSKSAVDREWEKLEGSWKHTNSNGNYRIKRISPYKEILEFYNKDGEKQNSFTLPMRIEIKGGLNHFYSLHSNGTYHGIYKVKEGRWYEQLRGMFRGVGGQPDGFLIYDKIE
jgi:hypothetical protein